MNIAHIIETGLIMLAAFLVGAIVGYIIRCMFFRPEKSVEAAAPGATVAKATPASAAPKSAPASPAAKPAAKKPAPKPAPAKTATPNADADGKPIPLSGPRDDKKDDLKRIKGIGPKIENTLNELGIYHFDQIAGWSSKTVSWINGFLSFKGRIQREKWISQAKALASGKETKFSKRVDDGKVPSSKK